MEKEKAQLKKRILILCDPSFHQGVNGIIAARLSEKYHLPSVILTNNEKGHFIGSARSIKGFNIFECINSCKDLCLSFGGHAHAAGLTVEEKNFNKFKNALYHYAQKHYKTYDSQPKIMIDGMLSFSNITESFVEDLKSMKPFGLGNSEPIFCTKNTRLKSNPKLMKGKHVKFDLFHDGITFEAIGFNLFRKTPAYLKLHDIVDIVYRIGTNTWLGQKKIQLELVDIKNNGENA